MKEDRFPTTFAGNTVASMNLCSFCVRMARNRSPNNPFVPFREDVQMFVSPPAGSIKAELKEN